MDYEPDNRENFTLTHCEVHNSYSGVTAKGRKEALEKFRDRRFGPDLYISGLDMPRINGMQCLKEIISDPELDQIPVVMNSPTSGKRGMEKTAKLIVVAFMRPPEIFGDFAFFDNFSLTFHSCR